MKYREAVDFLFDLRRFQVKPGTEAVRDLLAHLEDPHEGTTFVQVGGSNGKGSVARMVESILREAGYRVGLYTSPHFDSVRERIRVDGRKITETALCEFVDAAKPFLTDRAAAGEALTFFEAVTAMGLWHFGRSDVDVAVLEVGMGGKLDATSVVDPAAAAVTNVALEHTGVLGDTIAEIATAKAAIAPADAPLVTGATGEALEIVRETAGEVLTVGEEGDGSDPGADPDVTVSYEGLVNHTEAGVNVRGSDWDVDARLPVLGSYQASNAGIAAALARQVVSVTGRLDADEAPSVADSSAADASTDSDRSESGGESDGTPLSTETIARGLRAAHWPGRFEVFSREPLLVLDGAHNPTACEAVAHTLDAFDYDDLHVVFAAMHDKDHGEMAAALPAARTVTTCEPDLDRAESPDVLARIFEREAAGDPDVRIGNSVAGALRRAEAEAGPGDAILVVGSLFAVGEARTTRTRVEIPKDIEDSDDASRVLDGAHVTDDGVERLRDRGVYRVLATAVQRRQARLLKEELLALDGECAIAGVENDGGLIDVVLMGTLAQFEQLIENLESLPYGLPGLGEEIRETLGIGVTNASNVGDVSDAADASDVADTSDVADASGAWPWEDRTAVMGILNVTPDSFHDGGRYAAVEDAVAHAEEMVENGADIIDVGGESTRPGADPVPVEEELRRVVPAIERISDLDVLISVDTRRAEVGEAALDAGADLLNDVTGLDDPEMRFLAAERDVPIVVMHSIEAPVDPSRDVAYDDIVEDVIEELQELVLLAEKAGIPRERVVVDPGLGFGKSRAQNFELLGRTAELRALGCPILIGHSHKSMFDLIGEEDDRLASTVAASAIAADRGADIVRVHDVPENVAAVRAVEAADDPDAFAEE